MGSRVFIGTNGDGITRAHQTGEDGWEIEKLLSGRDVRCLAADPLSKQRVYAGTQGEGVLRSDDGGKTWRASGLDGKIIKSIAVSPVERQLVYAGTKPACLFVSRDGGESWQELESFRRIPWRWLWLSPAEKPFIGYVQGIALSPVDARHVAVGIELGATVVSRDGGVRWTRHRKGALRDCHSLVFHSVSGDWLYEGGGSEGGNACSRDGGRTWTREKRGLDRHYGWAVAADPEKPEIWYLSASPGPFKAHSENDAQAYIFRNKGNGWGRLNGGLPQPLNSMPYALLTEKDSPGLIFTGLSNGDIWQSDSYGEKWQQLPLNLGSIERSLVTFEE